MLLLSGPPGSRNSAYILGQIREALRSGKSHFRLLVPTATMAEHYKHRLAREGFLLRPGLILTLSKFVEHWTRGLPEASSAALDLLVADALAKAPHKEFEKVAHLEGLRSGLARLIEELAGAGCDSRRLGKLLQAHSPDAPFAAAFKAVYHDVETELNARGWALHSGRFEKAAEEIRERWIPEVKEIYFEGFFTFSAPELDVIRAMRSQANLTISLPAWAGSRTARAALLEMGFLEEQTSVAARPPERAVVVAAPGLDQEADEIARRILEHVAAGRQFREIGIVLRSQAPYVPVLRTVLERFGIPARFYFAAPLADHSVVRYLSGIVEALLSGWDHEQVLAVLKSAASGVGTTGACDRFDFAVRRRLPGKGLAGLRECCDEFKLRALLDRLGALECWRTFRVLPAEWAARAKSLRSLVQPPRITDGCSHETAAIWRSAAAALDAFDAAMDETALALNDERPIPLAEFWQAAKVALRDSRLRVPDRRRNVVHVLDVYEARQWGLPVVFLCGLLEKQFPLYHSQEPILPDAVRERLQRSGLQLKTSADRQREEEFLFELAVTRATSELVLSYPEFNAKGEPNLPSFFLEKYAGREACLSEKARAVRPLFSGLRMPLRRAAAIQSEDLLQRIRGKHSTMRPTAIETFLQCPFRFFAAHTLELESPPARPEERLDMAVQGAIIHRVLAEWQQDETKPLRPIFDRAFEEACAENGIAAGVRAELARLKMLRDLSRFAAARRLLEGWKVQTEKTVQFCLSGEVDIRGRMDLVHIGPPGAAHVPPAWDRGTQLAPPEPLAVVVDFKYRTEQGIHEVIEGCEDGLFVQGALYLLGLEDQFGYQPAGLFYYGIRNELSLDGWHTALPGLEGTGTSCTAEVLRELLEQAKDLALGAARDVRQGRIEAAAKNPDACSYCDFRDVCRARATGEVISVGGTIQ